MQDIISEIIEKLNNVTLPNYSVYISIVIGQITIYSILLTAYQFIASFQNGNQEIPERYLGKRIVEFYVSKKVKLFRIINNNVFQVLFIGEILAKPTLYILKEIMNQKICGAICYLWFLFVTAYMVIFVLLLSQIATLVYQLKNVSDIKRNRKIMYDINDEFIKRKRKNHATNTAVDILEDNLKNMKYAIISDDNTNLESEYNQLCRKILDQYLENKGQKSKTIWGKQKETKNRILYSSNDYRERVIVYELLDNFYLKINNETKTFLIDFTLQLIELYIKKLETEKKNEDIQKMMERPNWNSYSWEKIILALFYNSNEETQKRLINQLSYKRYTEGQCGKYCAKLLSQLIKNCLINVFEEKISQKEFCFLFEQIKYEREVEDVIANYLCDNIISYNICKQEKIIDLLCETNKIYIFTHIFFYYSIYSGRIHWENINYELWKRVLEWLEFDNVDSKKIVDRLKGKDVLYRYKNCMEESYVKLIQYIHEPLNGDFLVKVKEEKAFNVYYVFVIKTCIWNQIYYDFENTLPFELQISLLQNLLRNKELLENEKIIRFIYQLRLHSFSKLENISDDILESFEMLLLTDVCLLAIDTCDDKVEILYYSSVGKYALIKAIDMNKKPKQIRKIIKKAYESSNCSIDEYIEQISNICSQCCNQIDYVKKQKMRKYLKSIE